MKRSLIVIGWLGLGALLFSCSKKEAAQRKSYPEILYGKNNMVEVDSTRAAGVSRNLKTVRKAEAVKVDSALLLQPTHTLFTDPYFNKLIATKTKTFYQHNHFQTKWLYTTGPSMLYYNLITHLENADRYGLNPDDYNAALLDKAVRTIYEHEVADREDIILLDIRLTQLCLLFTTHLSEGRIRQTGYGNKLWLREIKNQPIADAEAVADVKSGKELEKVLEDIQPTDKQYKKLQEALGYFRYVERYAEDLPAVQVSGKIEPGMRSKAMPVIRKRLSQFDLQVYPLTLDTLTGQWDSLLYDNRLVQGIRAFQLLHGLEPDGVIGPMTITYLNQSITSRVGALVVNLDRIRWNTFSPKEEYILVNIPEYKLRIYDKQSEVLSMRVIVGTVENPTPVFNDNIQHVVFSPTWSVPVSIIKNEIIPRLKSNPDYYTEKNYVFYKNGQQIDPSAEDWHTARAGKYQIVQQPGADNSLGRVKFGMNNSMRIYLHDTPAQRLFSKDYRALSHGCIRLSEPSRFAEYVLRDHSGWDKERISKQMFSGKASTVVLKKSYPVHIQYCTAWVNDEGKINFRDDIYGHDRMQLQEFNKPLLKASGVIAGL